MMKYHRNFGKSSYDNKIYCLEHNPIVRDKNGKTIFIEFSSLPSDLDISCCICGKIPNKDD